MIIFSPCKYSNSYYYYYSEVYFCELVARLISMAANDTQNPEISTLEIKDEALTRGVQATFSARNSFTAYGVQRGDKIKNRDLPLYLHEVSPKSALYNDYVRKLVNETRSIFLSLNSRVGDMQEENKKIEIQRTSQQYRSVLIVCIEDLHQDSIDNAELLSLKQMFSDIELLWHLLQTLIIDSYSGTSLLYKLLHWIKWHFVSPERKQGELMLTEEPSHHPDYWDTVIQLLLQGNIKSVRTLLSLHGKCEREDFQSLDELLKKMPMYGTGSGISLNEFHLRWKYWQEDCKTRLGRGDFSSEENLEVICKILCGDHETLSAKSNLCENWYHLMISVYLYTDPCIGFNSLGDIARTYYNNVNSQSSNKSNLVDSIILAAMELDIINVIKLACSFNDGWWFAVHVMDLLIHGNYIGTNSKNQYAKQYRSFLLRNYADTLMSHHSMWQIGLDYLDYCEESRDLLELYLERVPLRNEAAARKVIYLAMKRNMDGLVKSVANVMTKRAITSSNLGTALTWVRYSKDVCFADEIADRWMKSYTHHKRTNGFEIFKNMGSWMLVSDKLTFVGKYCEFHNLYRERQLKPAASLLMSLLSSGLAPSNFQIIMLLDALPLLESPEMIFSSSDTYRLMQCLEDAVADFKNKADTEEHSKKEGVIRLALVRNLARSLVMETGDTDSENEM